MFGKVLRPNRTHTGTPGFLVSGVPIPWVYLSGHTEPTEISGTGIAFLRNLNEVSATGIEAVPNLTEMTGTGIEAVHKIC